MSSPGERTDVEQQLFDAAIRERNADAARIAAILVAVISPFFGILDRILIPEHAPELLWMRIGLQSLALGVLGLTRWARHFLRSNALLIALGMMLVVSWSIEVMVFLHEGYSSPYYAGICLVTITTGYLFLVRTRPAILYHVLVYLPFILPAILRFAPIHNPALFLTHQLFLLSTILIVFVSQRVRYGLEEREFFGNLALQRTRGSLEEALGSLRKLDELKSQFFNNITHELRTPLTLILAPIESMRSGELGDLTAEQRDLVDGVWKNGVRLLKLINDLLDLARMSERFLYLQVSQGSIRDVVGLVVDYARPLAARKRIDLGFEVESEPLDLHFDAEKMERVVVNLLSNALKFTDSGGRVTVTLGEREGRAYIAVRDTGIGIPEDKLAGVFERFTQVDASVTRRYGGSGIGLAFAQSIVQLHGGSIGVESEPDRGSTFTVLLPLGTAHFDPKMLDRRRRRDSEQGEPRRRGDDHGPREWAARLSDLEEYRFLTIDDATDRRRINRGLDRPKASRILVVEDNLDVAEFLNLHLRDEYTVLVAANGVEGLALAQEKKPDVIVTDYMMPEMDGLTMLGKLRERADTAGIPVILLSAKAQMGDRLDAREAGADVYLSKPFSPRELRAAIAQQIRRRGQQTTTLLRANTRSLEIVSAGLSHEINNPLNYIRTACSVIVQALPDLVEQQAVAGQPAERAPATALRVRKMCDTIEVGVSKIERVVELMTRYSQDGYAHVPVPVCIDDTILDAARLVIPRGEKHVDVKLDLGAGTGEVVALPEELNQCVSNLLQNAVDAVHEGGHVIIRTRVQGTSVVFEVSDDGPGMDAEVRERIFTPFFTTKAPGEGLGLGLAITQKVVGDAGGTIDVDSRPGVGTTFRVTLPRHQTAGATSVVSLS